MGIPVSAIIITKNEAAAIAHCLQTLQWLYEVILVGSGSTDDTQCKLRPVSKM